MNRARLRRALPDETPAVAEVFLAARRGLMPGVPMVHPDEDAVRWIGEVLFCETELWLADLEGRIVAMMSLAPGWVEHLYVHPDVQGAGIGTALLDLAKNNAMAANGLALWTFQVNASARRFYERHGFVAVELTDGSGNEEKTPDARYEWR